VKLLETNLTRVLVVDDYEPFRRFLCSALEKMPDLQIVGEASDGLEAVRKADELQPDLILLDIGLPKVNGIEAAKRILRLSPESRIVFVSQESSAVIVEEGLRLGAFGYVVKVRAASELFAAVEAVRQGRHFVSAGLPGHHSRDDSDAEGRPHRPAGTPIATTRNGKAACNHEVQFYSDDPDFVASLASFIETELEVGSAVIAVTTAPHRKSLFSRLRALGVDVATATEQGRFVSLDAHETLSAFVEFAGLNRERFRSALEPLICDAEAIAEVAHSRVVVFGEMVAVLCAAGRVQAAIELEQLWNELAQSHSFYLRCAYPMTEELEGAPHAMICTQHSAVLTAVM
jgi:DNA-binding NarL/FixJ family response regulator